MKRFILPTIILSAAILAACAQASPTPETMMKKETATPEAMMKKETATPEAMMKKETPTPDAMMSKGTPTGDAMKKLPDQLFAAHFVDSAPKHGDAFAQVPEKVVINFNFTLSDVSTIAVLKDDKPLTVGKVAFAANLLSMSATLPKDAGDGLYLVKYKACWPDKSCHEGQFAFKVDSKMGKAYVDMTGKNEVTIRLKDVKFNPSLVIVSKGTKVTWINDDPVTHFVNTDPHPSHNYLPALNSLGIKQGETYAFTFDRPGEFAYHCSAHVPDGMTAHIIVMDGAS